MITLQYIEGYFDAHGFAKLCVTRKGTEPRPKISFRDKDEAQINRIAKALECFNYHPYLHEYNPHNGYSKVWYWQLSLSRWSECASFAREIGSERPIYQARFKQFIEFAKARGS